MPPRSKASASIDIAIQNCMLNFTIDLSRRYASPPSFRHSRPTQHVIVWDINREAIFATDDDYRFYLEKLKNACEKYERQLHAYVLMTNHVHLLLTPGAEASIGKTIQSVGRYYVQYSTINTHAPERYGKGVTKRRLSTAKIIYWRVIAI